MPQLDIATFPSQLFWLAVSFFVLYFLMANMIIPKMQRIFTERESKISNALRAADEAKEEASKIENEYKAKLAHARKMTAISMAETASDLAKLSKRKIEESDKEFKKMLKNSEKEIAKFKVSAGEELKVIILQSVKDATKQFVGFEVSDEQVMSLIKESREQ